MKSSHSPENSHLFQTPFPILSSNLDIPTSISSKKSKHCSKFQKYLKNYDFLNQKVQNLTDHELEDKYYRFPSFFESKPKDSETKGGVYFEPFVFRKIFDKENQTRALRVGVFGVFPPAPAVVSLINRKCLRFHGFSFFFFVTNFNLI